MDRFSDGFSMPAGVGWSETSLGGVAAERFLAASEGPLVLYFHGGGYVMGSAKSHRHVTAHLAELSRGEVYSLDYRLAPEAPFPAAVEDAVSAYKALIDLAPGRGVVLAGDSAGGGLVFAAAVAVRDHGLPLPHALVGISPWVNLGTENESYDQLAAADPMLSRPVCDYFSSRYLAGQSAQDAGASPLFANLAGLPRTLIQVGDRECFFGDAVRMHQALVSSGVDSDLRVWKGMFHVWHLHWRSLAEGQAAIEEIVAFLAAAPSTVTPEDR